MDRSTGPRFNMIGKPIVAGRGSVPGIRFVTKEDTTMAKAETNGIYTLNGARFSIKAGDILPDGAVLDQVPEPVADPKEAEPEAVRALPGAPENKAKKSAPENRAKGN